MLPEAFSPLWIEVIRHSQLNLEPSFALCFYNVRSYKKYFRNICNTVFNSGLVGLKARTSQFP